MKEYQPEPIKLSARDIRDAIEYLAAALAYLVENKREDAVENVYVALRMLVDEYTLERKVVIEARNGTK